jgi:hypothetical protein
MANPHPSPASRRKRGTPNKASSARIERALTEGKRLPPEDLLALAGRQMAMVERYQPEITNDKGEKVPNEHYNEERYDHWMTRARETLAAAAPYYAPKLHMMAADIHRRTEVSISQKLETDATPQEAMREYIKLIDQKPL